MKQHVETEIDSAAVVLSEKSGNVLAQNSSAKTLFGDRVGAPCWTVVGQLKNAKGLPCKMGCTEALCSQGWGESFKKTFTIEQQIYQLVCASSGSKVISMITHRADVQPAKSEKLTSRQSDVLKLIADGHTSFEVAQTLSISIKTVRAHVEHMRKKFEVSSHAALVAKCIRLGLMQ